METTTPGQITTVSKSGIPTSAPVGFQIIKAATGAITLARTTLGVSEAPIGSGNYVASFTSPAEPDLYLIVFDWNAGAITPAASAVIQLRVESQDVPTTAALADIASYAKAHLGASTWTLLLDDEHYGSELIAQTISVTKANVFQNPPADESVLPVAVLNYLGLLVALHMTVPAAQAWASKPYSVSKGNDPVEIAVYTDRAKLIANLAGELRRKLGPAEMIALPLIDAPVPSATFGPAIDEQVFGARVTSDPRTFPHEHAFPYTDNGYFSEQS